MTASRALVLTAGLGTRLHPLTCIRAKAAIPVNGEPLVARIIRWLVAHGLTDLVLNLHHRPETIAALVGDGSDLGARARYSWEQPILGSAGGPRHALSLLADPFFIINGDTLTDVDLDALAAAHRESGAAVTMALIPNPRPGQYGGVAVADGWVSGFTRRAAGATSWHFIGVQMASHRVFAGLPDGVPAESVGSLYPALIARNPRAIRAFVSNASFHDIGTPDDCWRTSVGLAAAEGDRLVAPGARISESARVARTAVWDDVTIGAGASVVDCIVADGVRLPAGARYSGCAIVPAGVCAARATDRVERGVLIAPFAG